ncbi:MAG: TatD family hydrolase [Candidatus Verstraetearchaeota archaeon]|nr:TatD family hydrolase [Candidatus Verstraetearchaeota archaeon]
MKCIDSNTHTYFRGLEDLELMSVSGVEGVVLCSRFPVKPTGSSTVYDFFKWLMEEETARLASCGIDFRVAVGIHPSFIPKYELDQAIERVLAIFDNDLANALGEVGLETGSEEEVDVLVKQLRIAVEYDKPVIFSTPRRNREPILEKALKILRDECPDPSRVVVDHLVPELIPLVRESGLKIGLTIQPGLLTPADVKSIIEKYGSEGILLNSGLGSEPSDPLAVLRTAKYLDRAGIGGKEIQQVTYYNARSLFWF